jgi:hypothetical protein
VEKIVNNALYKYAHAAQNEDLKNLSTNDTNEASVK